MKGHTLQIREAEEKDYGFILSVNEENVEVLSPMDEEKLKKFAESAELLLVAEVDGRLAAFLIALQEGVDFYAQSSENYCWFLQHYPKFLYVDRIVLDERYRGFGIGRKLYEVVFRHAQQKGVPFVTAEIDTIPYNEVSLKFHEAMGFHEVGTQLIRGNSVKVSLQEAEVRL